MNSMIIQRFVVVFIALAVGIFFLLKSHAMYRKVMNGDNGDSEEARRLKRFRLFAVAYLLFVALLLIHRVIVP
jgi:heme O synthase-like polyprenyltransferase